MVEEALNPREGPRDQRHQPGQPGRGGGGVPVGPRHRQGPGGCGARSGRSARTCPKPSKSRSSRRWTFQVPVLAGAAPRTSSTRRCPSVTCIAEEFLKRRIENIPAWAGRWAAASGRSSCRWTPVGWNPWASPPAGDGRPGPGHPAIPSGNLLQTDREIAVKDATPGVEDFELVVVGNPRAAPSNCARWQGGDGVVERRTLASLAARTAGPGPPAPDRRQHRGHGAGGGCGPGPAPAPARPAGRHR